MTLVRHAAVARDLTRLAAEWELSEEGRKAAAKLARSRSWPRVRAVISSPEPKARVTAAPIAEAAGMDIKVEQDLREVDRGRTPLPTDADYQAAVRRYLAGQTIAGWEEQKAARLRFADCVAGALAEADGEVVVVSHGLVISLYLGLSFGGWQVLPMPALLQSSS